MNKGTKIFLFIAIPVIIILMIAGAAIAILPSSAAGLNLSAKLSELVGIVQVRDNPQANYNPVDAGFILKKVMQLQTKEKSKVRLDLSTGSILRLGQNTIFALDPPTAASGGVLSQIELQVGKVWVVLNGGTLEVNTPGGLASVRGSYMSVWVERGTNRITVCCLEGSCSFQNAGGIVNLTTGQKTISTDMNVKPAAQPMDQADIQDWRDNSPESSAVVSQVAPLAVTSTPAISPANTPTPTINPVGTLYPTYFMGFDPAMIQKCLSYGYESEQMYTCLLDLSMTITPWINNP